jgi:hypothetical protein
LTVPIEYDVCDPRPIEPDVPPDEPGEGVPRRPRPRLLTEDAARNDREGKFPADAGAEVDRFVLDLYSSMREEGAITHSTEFLAYTDQFELFYNEVQNAYPDVARRWVYRKLCGLRKKGLAKTRSVKGSGEGFKLTPAQVRILKALEACSPDGLTRDQISDRADVPMGNSLNAVLGPKFLSDVEGVEAELGKRTLRGAGHVLAECDPESEEIAYRITAEGKKALAEYRVDRAARSS